MELPSHIDWQTYQNSQALAQGLSLLVESIVEETLKHQKTASVALSGGSTPKAFLSELAHADIAWPQVYFTPVDERFVDVSSDQSNQNLFYKHLLNLHKNAHFISMVQDENIHQAVERYNQNFSQYIHKLDLCILGMGNDGHTASLFPDAAELAHAVSDEAPSCLVLNPRSAPQARISLSLPVLKQAKVRILHIEGEEKKQTLLKALACENPNDMPVRYILNEPLHIVWCP